MKNTLWKVHFTNDPATHWVNIDCGKPVDEKEAVRLAEKAMPNRGSVTNAVQNFDRS